MSAVLGEGLSFPYDFGFVLSTLGEDGDPLDGAPAVPRPCRAARHGGDRTHDRRTPKSARRPRSGHGSATTASSRWRPTPTLHQTLKKLADLRPHLLEEIASFFVHYASLNGKRLEVLARKGPRRAHRLLKAGMKFQKRRA